MPFAKGRSRNPSTQFKPGQSGNPSGKQKGCHRAIALTRIPDRIRKPLRLPKGATYEDVIALARAAAAKTAETPRKQE